MDRPVKYFPLWTVLAVMITSVIALQIVNDSDMKRRQAELLLGAFVPDGYISIDEYGALKEISKRELPLRLELAQLIQKNKRFYLNDSSVDILARNIVGFDLSGETSRRLVEELICDRLPNESTAVVDLPFYLIEWLNPSALDLEQCAGILTELIITSDANTFAEGAPLLAYMLGHLPSEQARRYIEMIVDQIAVARTENIETLLKTMRNLNHGAYTSEFAHAVRIVAERIRVAQVPRDIANLVHSLNVLVHKVPAADLVDLFDTIVDRLITQRDRNLTREIYLIFAEIKAHYPQASFGERADYLMRGINIFSDTYEIYDYSEVLRLEEMYPNPEQRSALGLALISGITNLSADDYVSSIWPYCQRFLDVSDALNYNEYIDGVKTLIAQLSKPNFIFQRQCLIDSNLVVRVLDADRPELAAAVSQQFDEMADFATTTRLAESVELLGNLGGTLTVNQLELLSARLSAEANVQQLAAVAHSLAKSKIRFPPSLYAELSVFILNAVNSTGQSLTIPLEIVERLTDMQRAYLIKSAISHLSGNTTPAVVAAHAELLILLKPWLQQRDIEVAASRLVVAMEDRANISAFTRLVNAFISLGSTREDFLIRLKRAHVRHILVSNERSDLAQLYNAAFPLGFNSADEEGRAVVRASAVRFLSQIVAQDQYARAVEAILNSLSSSAAVVYDIRLGLIKNEPSVSRALQPADVSHIADRYIKALSNERRSRPVTDFATSIEILAKYAQPGELSDLMHALRKRLDSSSTAESHDVLIAAWMAVERSTNQAATAEQRVPLYLDILQLPLINDHGRELLTHQLANILGQQVDEDWWRLFNSAVELAATTD